MAYSPPAITVTSLGSRPLVGNGPAGSTLLMLGTAPKGPDYPTLLSASQVAAMYGDPTAPAAQGYTLPLALYLASRQSMPGSTTPPQFLVCRAGVTRASLVIPDTTGSPVTAFTLYGIGAFAGSAGNNLRVVISTTGSGSSASVNSITINDWTTGAAVQVKTYTPARFDLSTAARIVAAINGDNPLASPSSVIQAVAGASNANVCATMASTTLAGGADGQTAAYNDATVAPLLANSLYAYADYIWAGFDAAQISTALLAHINTAVTANHFRKAILGPKLGTTYSSLASSYNTMQSDRVVCIGHDGVYGLNPATGISTVLDGFYLAAAYAGMKAAGPHHETGTGYPVAGFTGVAQAPDLSAPLTVAQQNTLGGLGLLLFEQPSGSAAPIVRDALTTAPLTVNAGLNPFSQFNVRDIDDQVAHVLAVAAQRFKGRPAISGTQQISGLQNAGAAALGKLGQTINGVNSVVASIDPNTQAQTLAASYKTRYPGLQINITTAYTF